MANDEDSEIFAFDEEQLSNTFTDIEVLHSGVNFIVLRAKRNGVWWTLKALSKSCQNIEMFRNLQQKEFNIQSSLSSPYIAQAFALEEVEGYGTCIVMEWVDGQNLRQWLATNPKRSARIRVLNQLLDAVNHMHKRQVVHRDLKPANIMITRNGSNVKVIDFGLADTDDYANLKLPSGTPGYIAPEQKTETDTDCRNDIYSLGCIIKELKLRRPYDVLAQHCTRPKDRRPGNINEVKHFLTVRHKLRLSVAVIAAFLVVAFAAWGCYQLQEENGRPHYEEEAKFRINNIKYTSWGGMQVSASSCGVTEEQMTIPATVKYKGVPYKVTEIGINSFQNADDLRVLHIAGDTLHILKGAFKGCTNLRELYIDCAKPVGIGSPIWPCRIDDIFDPHHFNDVTLYVRAEMLPLYRNSEWGKFKHIKSF